MLIKLEDLSTALLRAGSWPPILLVKAISLPAADFESGLAKAVDIATTVAKVRAHDSIGH